MTRDAVALAIRISVIAAIAGGGAWFYHWAPLVGAHARLERLEKRATTAESGLDAWRVAAQGWEASFRKSEGLRRQEGEQALTAITDAEAQCAARVARARASARVIEEITHAPVPHDQSGCPVRGVVGADRLRQALRPDARG